MEGGPDLPEINKPTTHLNTEKFDTLIQDTRNLKEQVSNFIAKVSTLLVLLMYKKFQLDMEMNEQDNGLMDMISKWIPRLIL